MCKSFPLKVYYILVSYVVSYVCQLTCNKTWLSWHGPSAAVLAIRGDRWQRSFSPLINEHIPVNRADVFLFHLPQTLEEVVDMVIWPIVHQTCHQTLQHKQDMLPSSYIPEISIHIRKHKTGMWTKRLPGVICEHLPLP